MTIATLSPLQQKIYHAAKNAKDGVIFLEIIESLELTDKNTLLSTLSKMCKKNWLIRLRNEVYLVCKDGLPIISDPFVISTYIFKGYNAFSSALYLHKLTDMIPFEVIVATKHESGKKTIGEYSFRATALKKRYLGTTTHNDYKTSTVAKTIYDCLKRPEIAGGYPTIVKAIYEAKLNKKQWEEFFYYVKKFEKAAFYQRLGYLLDILPKKSVETKKTITRCLKKVKSKVYLSKRKRGKYNQKWKLIDNIGKKTLLSWWY